MDVIEAIRLRKSIRGYKPDPVPKEVLREILGIATRVPSALNVQPWEIAVVTGEVCSCFWSRYRRLHWDVSPLIQVISDTSPPLFCEVSTAPGT